MNGKLIELRNELEKSWKKLERAKKRARKQKEKYLKAKERAEEISALEVQAILADIQDIMSKAGMLIDEEEVE